MIINKINHYKSKNSGKIGTLVVHQFVASQEVTIEKKGVATTYLVGEVFETVSWESNPDFIPMNEQSDFNYELNRATLPLMTMSTIIKDLTPQGAMVFFGKGALSTQSAESFPVF